MDKQDLQDDHRSALPFGETTEKMIDCAFEVINELGNGFLGNPKLAYKRFTRHK